MILQKKGFLLFLALALSVFLSNHAQTVIVENSLGNRLALEISAEDSFHDVISTIQHSLSETEGMSLSEAASYFNMHVSEEGVLVRAAAKGDLNYRDYYAPLSESEANDISYIVTTLTNKSLFHLKTTESSLKAAGDRIDHVHPFQFLSYVFTNQELIVCMRNFQGRAWVWRDFIKGLSGSLTEEKAKHNLMQFIHDFAKTINVNPHLIRPTIKKGKWEELVDILIENVQRTGDSGRYDM